MNTNGSIINILFPTDFSELSGNALLTAIAMCKRQNARLHLLHVIENRFLIVPREAHNSTVYLMPHLEKEGMERLTQLAKKIETTHGIATGASLVQGNPAEAIGNSATELNCDLIVMGTHGISGFREFFIGSTAYAVIKNTIVPVLTVPGEKKAKEFKRILFPIRVTKGIMDKYDFIEPVIEKNKAELIIAGLSLPGEEYNLGPMDEEIRKLGKSLRINHTRFKSEYLVCQNYAKKVLELAKKEKADLIVISASLDYNWRQFFIGPYVQQVVNHSRIPVLTIRKPDTNLLADDEKTKDPAIGLSDVSI